MIEHDLICDVAERVEEYYAAHNTVALRELYLALGVDEEVAAHYFKHARELAPKQLDVTSFGYGLLMGLLTGIEINPPELTDDDLRELLNG